MRNVTPIQELLLGSFAKPFFRAKSTALLVRKHERHTEYRHPTKRLENTENPRPDSSQIRQKSMLVPGENCTHTLRRKRRCGVCTNRGRQNNVLLDNLIDALEDVQDKMSVVVTPLNLLGEQNVWVLEERGLLTRFPDSLSFLSSPISFVVDIWVYLQELTE